MHGTAFRIFPCRRGVDAEKSMRLVRLADDRGSEYPDALDIPPIGAVAIESIIRSEGAQSTFELEKTGIRTVSMLEHVFLTQNQRMYFPT
jgi:hypothetical protein